MLSRILMAGTTGTRGLADQHAAIHQNAGHPQGFMAPLGVDPSPAA
jgi:hypothetical protein